MIPSITVPFASLVEVLEVAVIKGELSPDERDKLLHNVKVQAQQAADQARQALAALESSHEA